MINFHTQLQAYEAEKVNLSDAVRDGLYAKREVNRDRLKANLPADIRIKEFIPQGSMAIRTTIQEANADYDIDDGVAFYAGTLTGRYLGIFYMTCEQVREMVCEALMDEKFAKQPEIIGNCIRVFYAEGLHVDVPVFQVLYADTSDERQELAGKDGWRPSDSTAINVWFESRVQRLNRIQVDAGAQLRRMVRLLKRFAKSRGKQWNMPNGLKLTMLAEECFERSAERDDKAFFLLLEKLHARLRQSLVVVNRAQSQGDQDELTKSEADENMFELGQHVGEALVKLNALWDEKCSQQMVRDAWEWVFQAAGFFHQPRFDGAPSPASAS